MSLFNLYTWATGSKAAFLNSFQNQDEQYEQAQAFWNGLENNAIAFVGLFLALGIAWAWFYYGPYNNMPGRHYRPTHWCIFLGICAVSTFVFTLGAAYLIQAPKLDGAWSIEIKLSLANTLYAVIIYIITSIIYCSYLPTNAYRLLKL
ncbi:hypothetical protein PRBRB14_21960 [Hallella multisaccharivorax DSM 17128]|uniref:Uncharacterized protein n=1 Tax=Hallella multisaccharivorax DSM 17128 TaxID=688246 RepID=F8N7I3_9BACT|nr:hypothetical protein [Hallella multisaccharivorax]EGN57443.1 hypothetical protein Premu_2049 [Hallella multisaccharivorax DSM 17128]GJG31317.1 hypothetical protein PRBRB14_21960 [Hallella multisaccharivorax DSM 17128]